MVVRSKFYYWQIDGEIGFSRLLGNEDVSTVKRFLKPFRKRFQIWLDSEIQEPSFALMESRLFHLLWIMVDK